MKTSEFAKIPQSLIKMPEKKLQLFGLGYSAKWKAPSGKTSEIHVYSPRFPCFARNQSFRPHKSLCHVPDSFNGQL